MTFIENIEDINTKDFYVVFKNDSHINSFFITNITRIYVVNTQPMINIRPNELWRSHTTWSSNRHVNCRTDEDGQSLGWKFWDFYKLNHDELNNFLIGHI